MHNHKREEALTMHRTGLDTVHRVERTAIDHVRDVFVKGNIAVAVLVFCCSTFSRQHCVGVPRWSGNRSSPRPSTEKFISYMQESTRAQGVSGADCTYYTLRKRTSANLELESVLLHVVAHFGHLHAV